MIYTKVAIPAKPGHGSLIFCARLFGVLYYRFILLKMHAGTRALILAHGEFGCRASADTRYFIYTLKLSSWDAISP